MNYQQWIEAHVPSDPAGMCHDICVAMQIAFPELQLVRGHYYCPFWGEREHWWLVDSDGLVIDPTVAQFPSKGIGEYIPWIEGTPEPTGKCPNCGELCYDGNYCCSEQCGIEYAAYCMNP